MITITDYMERISHDSVARRPRIVKRGTVKYGTVETTPIVWQDRLLCFEWYRPSSWGCVGTQRTEGYYRFFELETGESVGAPFAEAHAFGCAYAENGIMYAHGVRGSAGATNAIDVFWSRDLVNWESREAIVLPEELAIYNTSVCRGENGYVMAIEVHGPRETYGRGFTILFATSSDLLSWTLLPPEETMYVKERYAACPSIRYFDGFYYMVYLEALPYHRYVPYVVRTRDFSTFEPSILNPFMMYDDEDKHVPCPENFSEEELALLNGAVDCNNSDVDFCDWQGKTVITYSWGNQKGKEFLAVAEYDGSLRELLTSFFND